MLPPSLGEIARSYPCLLHSSHHTIQKDESISVLHDRKCFSTAHDGDDCDDGNPSIRPTSTPYSPAVMSSSPEHKSPPESPTPTSSPPVRTTNPAVQHELAKPDSLVTSSTPEAAYTKATSPSPSPTSTGNNDPFNWNWGGLYVLIRLFLWITDCHPSATYYDQLGNPGACGEKHNDTELIAAIGECIFGTNSI
jgi:hypothetical protein